jgi:small GTP-binding protein
MIRRKICMLGAFAAGKTSLVRRFAHGLFSDRYRTTVGVSVEKKSVELDGEGVDLIVWDLYGEDEFQKVRESYLKGAAGVFYVVDGTRAETLDVALALRDRVEGSEPGVPSIALVNKTDDTVAWELDAAASERLQAVLPVREVSARTGAGVDEAFLALARLTLNR